MFDSQVITPQLTARQQAVLEVLRQYTAEHGYPPTVREIGDVLGMASSSTVHSHLAALERAGIIERDPTKPRALRWGPNSNLLGADGSGEEKNGANAPAGVCLPLLGRVAAGAPILAQEHIEQYVSVPRELTKSGSSFLLKIRGDSMQDAGILDGDWVVVRHQAEAQTGQIVVALVDEDQEATCKRLELREGRVILHSENSMYAPLEPESCEISGVVTGVMRTI